MANICGGNPAQEGGNPRVPPPPPPPPPPAYIPDHDGFGFTCIGLRVEMQRQVAPAQHLNRSADPCWF